MANSEQLIINLETEIQAILDQYTIPLNICLELDEFEVPGLIAQLTTKQGDYLAEVSLVTATHHLDESFADAIWNYFEHHQVTRDLTETVSTVFTSFILACILHGLAFPVVKAVNAGSVTMTSGQELEGYQSIFTPELFMSAAVLYMLFSIGFGYYSDRDKISTWMVPVIFTFFENVRAINQIKAVVADFEWEADA